MKLGPFKAPIPPTSPPKMLSAPPVTLPVAVVLEKLPLSSPAQTSGTLGGLRR